MNVRNLVVSLSLGVLVFIVGIGLGVLYQGNKSPAQPQAQVQVQTLPDSIKVLSSKIVSSITAIGKVTRIDGMDVTLTYLSDSRVVKMASDVGVYGMVSVPVTPLNKNKYIAKQGTFKDIEVNDNLEVNVRVLPNGQLEGFNVIILPVTPVVPVKK